MKKWTTCITLLFLVACGGSDVEPLQMSGQSIEPGEECPNGGVILSIDGEDHVICNGEDGATGDAGESGDDATLATRRLDAGEADNPCEGDALEITVTEPGQDPVVDYVCESYDPTDYSFTEAYIATAEAVSAIQTSDCVCDWDLDFNSLEECRESQGQPQARIDAAEWCVTRAYNVFDQEAPQELLDFLNCQVETFEEIFACEDVYEGGDACTPEADTAYNDCRSAIDPSSCEDEMTVEAEEWLESFEIFFEPFCRNL